MAREWDSTRYQQLSNHQFAWGKKVLERLHLRGDETVLDAGCGTGRVTAELARLLPCGRVVAVDLSQNMLLTAQKSLCGTDAPSRADLHFVCASMDQLPFRADFDGAFSTAAFHWVKDHDRLFASLFAVLKPGAWLEAQCGGGANLLRVRRHGAAIMAEPQYARYFQGWDGPWTFLDPEPAAQRLLRAGFVDVKTSLESAAFRLSTVEDYYQYFATVTFHAHTERLPDPTLRERFLRTLAERVFADPDRDLDYWRLNLSARKPSQAARG